MLALLEVLHQLVGHQEVRQVVHADRELVAVRRERGLSRGGQIDGGIAHEAVERAAGGAEVGDELAHRLQGREVALDVGEVLTRDAVVLGRDLYARCTVSV